MNGRVDLAISQPVLLAIILSVFAVIGFQRGARRELFSTVGIVLGILFTPPLSAWLKRWVNLFYRLGRFFFSGAFASDDLGAEWQKAKQWPDLLRTDAHMQLFAICLFFLIVLVFVLVSQWRSPRPSGVALRALGLAAGGINGFLIAYYLSPYLFSAAQATITLPSAELRGVVTERQNIALVAFAFVTVMIVLGLYGASAPKRK